MLTIITKTRLQSIPFFVVLLTNRRFYTSLCYWNAPRTAGITHNNDYQVDDVKKKKKTSSPENISNFLASLMKTVWQRLRDSKIKLSCGTPLFKLLLLSISLRATTFFWVAPMQFKCTQKRTLYMRANSKLKQSSHLRNVQGWQFPQLERSW